MFQIPKMSYKIDINKPFFKLFRIRIASILFFVGRNCNKNMWTKFLNASTLSFVDVFI